MTESRVTDNAAVFRMERTNVSREIDLLTQFPPVKTGSVLNGRESLRQKGATFALGETSISGIRKSTIWAHPPWQDISGDTFGEWNLSLPDSPNIRLEVDIGLAEGSENSDGVTFIVSVQGDEIFRRHHTEQKWEQIHLDLTPYQGEDVKLRFTTNPGPKENTGWDWAVWGEPKIAFAPSNMPVKVGFYFPNEPIRSFPDIVKDEGNGQYSLETELPTQVLFFFESGAEVVSPYNVRNTDFVVGLQVDDIFRLGSVWNSGQKMGLTLDGVRKETIFAHPPGGGQTVLQFLLSLPHAREVKFTFSMGLQDGCSDGVFFKVLVNGETQFEHFADTFIWEDANMSLSRYAGNHVLLELITDPGKDGNCDWAHWADLFITAKGVESSGDVNQDGMINVLDIILVAQNLGQKPPSESESRC